MSGFQAIAISRRSRDYLRWLAKFAVVTSIKCVALDCGRTSWKMLATMLSVYTNKVVAAKLATVAE